MDMSAKHFIETPGFLPKRKRETGKKKKLDKFPPTLDIELKMRINAFLVRSWVFKKVTRTEQQKKLKKLFSISA